MITRETDYGIRLVLCLADHYEGGGLVSTAVISKRMEIPYRYLRTVARRLVAGGLIESKRGKCGGVRLTRPPDKISLLDVVQVLDSRGAVLNSCLLEEGVCPRDRFCRVHGALTSLQLQLEASLSGVTFAKLLNQEVNRVEATAQEDGVGDTGTEE